MYGRKDFIHYGWERVVVRIERRSRFSAGHDPRLSHSVTCARCIMGRTCRSRSEFAPASWQRAAIGRIAGALPVPATYLSSTMAPIRTVCSRRRPLSWSHSPRGRFQQWTRLIRFVAVETSQVHIGQPVDPQLDSEAFCLTRTCASQLMRVSSRPGRRGPEAGFRT